MRVADDDDSQVGLLSRGVLTWTRYFTNEVQMRSAWESICLGMIFLAIVLFLSLLLDKRKRTPEVKTQILGLRASYT